MNPVLSPHGSDARPAKIGRAIVCIVLLLASAAALAQNSTHAADRMTAPPPWPLWNAYKAHFIDAGGRVIDHDASDRTTSEGQAYAMFFSLVAKDREQFDHLLQWTVENLAQGDLTAHLPAWEWGHAPDGTWRVLDPNSASDADLWIAYTLLQAGRLWNEPRYRSLGLALTARISQLETRDIPGLGWTLLPAASGFEIRVPPPSTPANHRNEPGSAEALWILNLSYSPLPVLTGLVHADPHGPWRAIANELPTLLERSSVQGFAMDWVGYQAHGSIVPAALPGLPKGTPPIGSYDAIRVYLWAGIAPASMSGARGVLQSSPGMQHYLANHAIPPRSVNPQGTITAADGPVGFSAALLPYLAALHASQSAAQQQNRLAALLDPRTGLYGSPPRYYDQNLALFAEGWQQHRYLFSADGELQTPWHTPAAGDSSGHYPSKPHRQLRPRP